MFVSKYNKTYDTADGSEQRSTGVRPHRTIGDERGARAQWDDDGGRPSPPPQPAESSPSDLTAKPAWSVLPLDDLNHAIRAASDPAHLRDQEARQIEIRRNRATVARIARLAAAARARRDIRRNAWEHA